MSNAIIKTEKQTIQIESQPNALAKVMINRFRLHNSVVNNKIG